MCKVDKDEKYIKDECLPSGEQLGGIEDRSFSVCTDFRGGFATKKGMVADRRLMFECSNVPLTEKEKCMWK